MAKINLRDKPEPSGFLTEREKELFLLCCGLTISDHNSNPDVGMGPSYAMIIDEVEHRLSFKLRKEDKLELLEKVRKFNLY